MARASGVSAATREACRNRSMSFTVERMPPAPAKVTMSQFGVRAPAAV